VTLKEIQDTAKKIEEACISEERFITHDEFMNLMEMVDDFICEHPESPLEFSLPSSIFAPDSEFIDG
jgi:hypothetical protein